MVGSLALSWIDQSSTVHITIKKWNHMASWILFVPHSFSFLSVFFVALRAFFLGQKHPPGCIDDAFYPTLGYLCGLKSPRFIPAIVGLETLKPTRDDLKAFSAAFGTSSSAAMFHLVGLTPEAVWREVWYFGSLEMGWPTFEWGGVVEGMRVWNFSSLVFVASLLLPSSASFSTLTPRFWWYLPWWHFFI